MCVNKILLKQPFGHKITCYDYGTVCFGVHVIAVDKRNTELLFTTSITFFYLTVNL